MHVAGMLLELNHLMKDASMQLGDMSCGLLADELYRRWSDSRGLHQ